MVMFTDINDRLNIFDAHRSKIFSIVFYFAYKKNSSVTEILKRTLNILIWKATSLLPYGLHFLVFNIIDLMKTKDMVSAYQSHIITDKVKGSQMTEEFYTL